MLIGGVIIKVFLISPLYLVRLCTLSGFAACPVLQLVRVRTRPRVLYPRALPIQKCSYVILRSPFARPSLALRSSFAQLFSTKISKNCPSLFLLNM